ncbi:hypothetical protein GOV05_05090 [Candidatus Woesearchaeota archaeon]|nr:hypothetical protein [Candidatus Woesearchaeota archaeon]
MGSDLETKVFFELPGSPIKGIPLKLNGDFLDIGFIEVGCKPSKKKRQAADKKELFLKYWGDVYREEKGITWIPDVYRIVVHYDSEQTLYLGGRKNGIDAEIFYSSTPQGIINNFTEEEKEELVSSVNRGKRQRLEKILLDANSDELHELITNSESEEKLSVIRGKLAEALVLRDVDSSLPSGMNLYKNGDIRYFNKRYQNGTEIDGVLIFYGKEYFDELINNLRSLDHLNIRD